jgi:hypothetical protein
LYHSGVVYLNSFFIEEAEFIKKREKLIKEKCTILQELNKEQGEKFEAFMDFTERYIELFQSLRLSYKSMPDEVKALVLDLCTSNFLCLYDGGKKKLRVKPAPLVQSLLNIEENHDNVSLVVPRGIEPLLPE